MDDKQRIRERIWSAIERSPEVRRAPGAVGRIPNFVGAEAAAARLAALDAWALAERIKINPDSPQLPVRALAIDAGKRVYVPVPKLASEAPFFELRRERLGPDVPALEAGTIEGARRHGLPVQLAGMPALDFVVCGSVAVNAAGVRVGKGGGYADLEFALLAELGLVNERTLLATTVHDLQLVSEDLPETAHDFRVDIVVTPTRVLQCPRVARPTGIVWSELDPKKIAAIPVLQAWAGARQSGGSRGT